MKEEEAAYGGVVVGEVLAVLVGGRGGGAATAGVVTTAGCANGVRFAVKRTELADILEHNGSVFSPGNARPILAT